MVYAKKKIKPIQYIIQVKGNLGSHWEHWFEGMKIEPAENGLTIISGDVIDQSELLGILEKIHSLNLPLISVQQNDPDTENQR